MATTPLKRFTNITGRWRMLVALLVASLAIWLLAISNAGPVRSLASALSDPYYAFNPGKPSKQIVFIAVDHEAVKRFGRWPWSRQVLAQEVKKLDQAAVVLFDMVFSEATQAEEDRALGAAMASINAVAGFQFNGVIPAAPGEAAESLLANSALTEIRDAPALIQQNIIELSVPDILSGSSALGAMNTLPDPDERFRRYPVAFLYQQMALPALGVQALRLFLNEDATLHRSGKAARLDIGARIIQLDHLGFTRLNFYPAEDFTVWSFARLTDPGFDPLSLSGKIVLLGVTEAGITDIRATPLGQYPGALLHATFVSNVLEGHTLSEPGNITLGWLLPALALVCFSASFIGRLWLRLTVYLGLLCGFYLAGILLYVHAQLWLETLFPLLTIGASALIIETGLLDLANTQSRMLRSAFSSYVPRTLVDRLVEQPEQLRLGGEKKVISVLFSDIRGFTTMSETMSPEQVAGLMLQYFQPMTEAIFAENGTLDKYIGDAIMAIFNAPLEQPDHAAAACRAAIAMQHAQLAINDALIRQGLPALKTGIGINTGPAVVGNLGSQIRFNYTAVGDSVNLASRFESSTKHLGVDIVIGEATHQLIEGQFPCREIGEIEIPGKEKRQKVYELCWWTASKN